MAPRFGRRPVTSTQRSGLNARSFHSADVSVGTGVTQTDAVVLHGTDVLTIAAGGTLAVADATAITWAADATDVVVDNAGRIAATGFDGLTNEAGATGRLTFNNAATGIVEARLSLDDLGAGAVVELNNHGLMTGAPIDFQDTGAGVATTINNFADGVISSGRASSTVMRVGMDAVVNNAGVIKVADDVLEDGQPVESGGDAINFNQNTGGIVHNLTGGVIEGSRHGITGKRDLTVVNDAGGLIVGRNGSAINIDNNGSAEQTVHVTNFGTLQGKSANYEDSDGDAVDVDGLIRLDNYGLVQGLGAAGYHDGGINTSEAIAIGGGVINNSADGVIYSVQRAIQVDDSSEGAALGATRINNNGRIESADGRAINIVGSFADTLTNKGDIIGGVKLGGGADNVFAYTGSSFSTAVDTGSGIDTITLRGTGEGSFAGAVNAENLNVSGGTWAVESGIYKQVHVASGAGLSTTLHAVGSVSIAVDAGAVLDAGEDPSVLLSGPLVGAEIANAGNIRGIADDGDGKTISGSLAIYNEADGVISANEGGAGIKLDAELDGGSLLIDNAGTIRGSADEDDFAINLRDVSGGSVELINSGFIETRADKDVLRGAENMTIENTGVIQSLADDVAGGNDITGGDAIDFQSNGGGYIHNAGYISGSRHGITGEGGLTVVNDANHYILGNNGAGINMDNDASVANTVHVTNNGYIFGASQLREGSDSDGDGIDVDGLLQLDNHGFIDGFGATGTNDGEVNISDGLAIGGGVVNNYGTISSSQRAIQVDDSHDGAAFAAFTLHNEGSIIANELHKAGEIDLAVNIVGDFGDTIVNSGTIDGRVSTGGGADTVTVLDGGIVTGKIDLGLGNDTVEGGSGDNVIEGGGGIDTASYAHAASGVTVSLATSAAQNTGGGGIDSLIHVEALTGSAFADTLFGSAASNTLTGGAGRDRLLGGDGNDKLIGGSERDVMTGGAGIDRFVYLSAGDTGTTFNSRDAITDFRQADHDRIDLNAIDANAGAAGNQAFRFLGDAAFSGHAGELRAAFSGSDTLIEGDVSGDGKADFQITLIGHVTLASTDFLL